MKVSVAMCTYNGARFLDEQIASIANQIRPPDELVVCDDRSTDGTVAIVRGWTDRVGFPVRLHVNDTQLGSTRNFERAVGFCSGDLIALADQDDVWLPAKLAIAQKAFEEDRALGALFSDAELVDQDLRPLGRKLSQAANVNFDERHQRLLVEGRIDEAMLLKSFVTGATMTFRSKFRELAIPFPTDLPMFIHDRWLAVLVLAVSKLRFVTEPLILYRQHGSQQLGAKLTGNNLFTNAEDKLRRDPAVFRDELNAMQRLKARLDERSEFPTRPEFADALAERMKLLAARAALPRRRLKRVLPIASQLKAGRYHRFANGSLSAVKDLLR